MKKTILVLNGPNLNLTGTRQKEIYGDVTMDECIGSLKEKFSDHNIIYHQSNHEGVLIDHLHRYGFEADGIVFNAGAYTHTSIALRDAIEAIEVPVIELHISDVQNREDFRKHSFLTDVCFKLIQGKGLKGYEEAINCCLTEH